VRWVADECVDAALVSQLRGGGHDLLYVAEIASGATDAEVLRRARNDSRLLLTEDKDFGELLFRLKLAVPGLVLLKWARLEAAIGQFGDKLFGRYLVIEDTRFRSRPLLRSVRGSPQ